MFLRPLVAATLIALTGSAIAQPIILKPRPNMIVVPPPPAQTLTVVYTGTFVSGVILTTNPKVDFKCSGLDPSAAVPKVQKSCSASFPAKSYVDLYAKRITGLGSATLTQISGKGWGGACANQGPICTIHMDKPQLVAVVDVQ